METDEKRKMTRLIRELCGGKPISELQLNIIPSLLEALDEAKQVAIVNGQVERLKKLQSVIMQVQDYEKQRRVHPKKRPSTATTRSPKKEPVQVAPMSVVESVYEDILSGFPYDVAETYLLPSLIRYGKDLIDGLLSQGEYKEAQRVENINKDLIALQAERNVEEQKQNKRQQIVDQLEIAKQQYQKESEELKLALEEHDERSQTALEALDAEIEEQLMEYDNITQGPLPSQYIKYSSALLNLRETEKFLVKSRRFEEAANIKEEADQKERQELIDLQQKFIAKRMQQRQTLIESFNTKKRCLEEKNARIRMKIEQDHKAELAALKKTVQNQQKRLDIFDGIKTDKREKVIDKDKLPRTNKQLQQYQMQQQITFVTNRGMMPPLTPKGRPATQQAVSRPKTSRLVKLNATRK